MSHDSRAMLNGLDPDYAKRLADALNVYLANLHVVYVKVHNFHWNVTGVDFFEFHEKLKDLYEQVAMHLDDIAERIRALGHWPLASMHEFLRCATLREAPSVAYNTPAIAHALVGDFSETARYLREVDRLVRPTSDEYTIQLLEDAFSFLEKNVWFFSAYLCRLDSPNPPTCTAP